MSWGTQAFLYGASWALGAFVVVLAWVAVAETIRRRTEK